MKSYASIRQARFKRAIIDLLGGKCVRCCFDDYRALQIDHVDGNSKDDPRNVRRGGTVYYSGVLKFLIENPLQKYYQLLCANCNWIKRAENNENPNKRINSRNNA